MQSLLSPAESHAFQSFLSTMDFSDDSITPSEWAIYNSQSPMHDDSQPEHIEASPERREALTKATKDLMSLDADGWDSSGSLMNHHPSTQNYHAYDVHGQYDVHQQERHFVHQQHAMEEHQRHQQLQQQLHHQQRQNAFSSSSDLFPFLHTKVHQQPPTQEMRYPMQRQQQQQQPPQHPHLALSPTMTASNSDHGSPTSPAHAHPFGGFQQQQAPQHQNQPHQVHIPPHPRRMSPPSGSTTRSKRLAARSASAHPDASASTPGSGTAPASAGGIRSNNGTAKRARSSTSPSITSKPTPQPGGPKQPQTLLSPSQKKANHIQSEQKRRANIRRGYEALCETVPALREAIREEEEAERNTPSGQRGAVNGAPRKKGRTKKGQKESEDKEKDKLDGRAGPRSENVVLSKSSCSQLALFPIASGRPSNALDFL